MKVLCVVFLIVSCVVFAAPAHAQVPAADPDAAGRAVRKAAARTAATQKIITTRKLSVRLKDVPLQETLEMLTAHSGVGLSLDGRITEETLRRPLSLTLEKSSVYAVLHWVFRKQDLCWAVDGREIVVGPPELIDAGIRNEQIAFAARTEKEWRARIVGKLDETRMSLNVAGVPLVRVMELVAEHAGVNLVWEPGAEKRRHRRTSIRVVNTPVGRIFDTLTAKTGLKWSLEAEAVLISIEKP